MSFCLFAAFLLNVSLVFGQPKGIPQFQATVVVTDSNGARISGAEVLIERYDERTTAQTDKNGLAHLRILIGHYRVKVSADGFKTAEFSDFAVNNDEALLNVVLDVGKAVSSPGDFPPEEAQTIPSNLPWNLVSEQPASIEKEHFLDGQFKVVSKTEVIPANVKQVFSKMTRQTSFAMANPGQAFQVTDEVLYRKLPWRRLVFAGVQGDKWFLHYERGGLAHSYYVVAFKADPHGDARFVWGCSTPDGAKALEQLRTMVATCRLSDDAEGYW